MKKIFLSAIMLVSLSCVKEQILPGAPPPRCGWVTDKKFQSPPGDTTAALRTYWVLFAVDTVCAPFNPNCQTIVFIQVPKTVYDTMFANRYPERYCY